jgi:hypothetical protein
VVESPPAGAAVGEAAEADAAGAVVVPGTGSTETV